MSADASPEKLSVLPRHNFGLPLLGALSVAALFAVALLASPRLIYDEAAYLAPVAALRQMGLSSAFLQNYPEPAGLLHVVLQGALAPLTGLRAPGVRMVNPALLVVAMGFVALAARRIGDAEPVATAAALVAVPSVWVVTGMALTEMLGFALLSASVWLLLEALAHARRRQAAAPALAGGLALGLSFLDRAPTLAILGALPCLFAAPGGARVAVLFACGALGVALPVIWLWGGLVPPHSAVPAALTDISIEHLALSATYAAFAMLILAPRWFRPPSRKLAVAIAAVAALDAATGYVEVFPFRSSLAGLPPVFAEVGGRLLGAAMTGVAALFVVSAAGRLLQSRREPIDLFLGVAMALLILAPAKIVHQFSSRYVVLASGLMLLAGARWVRDDPWRTARAGAGAGLGFATLLGYYHAD